MKKYGKNTLSVLIALAMTLPTALHASAITVSTETQNPYVEAYLMELSQKATVMRGDVNNDETIASLNTYYQKDETLASKIREYVSADFDTDMITSIVKSDKIDAMHYFEIIYENIADDECIKLINDYFRRYASDSGDEQAINFYESIKDSATSSELMSNGYSVRSTTYDDNFSPSDAADWAYENYDDYDRNFPQFTKNNFSDCTNFVSQALYYGGMEMHGDWYCYKLNDTYPIPANSTQLDYSWDLADPSPWCSVEEFVFFWDPKCDTYYEFTESEYTENHSNVYSQSIGKGDVIILCRNTLWWDTPSHAMIISRKDSSNRDFLCAGHSNNRQALPLLDAIASYGSVRIYCL